MNKVKRAIIMAAGVGKRLRPITLTTPKPLVQVNGTSMIETVIAGLHENGINEIYIVVGYLKEQFLYLLQKYTGIVLIDNPYYDICNNISSLYVARDFIGESMILDGDLIIKNSAILNTEFESSGYNCVWTEQWTDEWLLTVEDGFVKSCSRTGGERGWQLYSISRWSMADGERLKRHVEIEFEHKGNCQIYWDDIALFCYPGEYQLGIKRMKREDVIEVDSLNELIALDNSYRELGEGNNGKSERNKEREIKKSD